jgi:hypothetical protein
MKLTFKSYIFVVYEGDKFVGVATASEPFPTTINQDYVTIGECLGEDYGQAQARALDLAKRIGQDLLDLGS